MHCHCKHTLLRPKRSSPTAINFAYHAVSRHLLVLGLCYRNAKGASLYNNNRTAPILSRRERSWSGQYELMVSMSQTIMSGSLTDSRRCARLRLANQRCRYNAVILPPPRMTSSSAYDNTNHVYFRFVFSCEGLSVLSSNLLSFIRHATHNSVSH